jgi:hypothetical protein
MLSDFMISRSDSRLLAVVLGVAALVTVACEKVPLLAPTGSTITLTSATTALPVHGTADLIATVLESAGTPPHSGTLITFTTSLGSIEPSEARTDTGGRVVVKFRAGNSNGTATISATSGAATTGTEGSVRIAVGTAAVGRVIVNASPATVSALGGSTSVSASVLDINGNVLPATPVAFTTTAGTLSAALINTDLNGVATITLTTSQQATVTASVGATAPPPPATGGGGTPTTPTTPASSGQASGSVTVNVVPAPTITIDPPVSPPSAGLPASFVITVAVPTGGSAVRDVRITWGDGGSQSLGALNGKQTVTHVYSSDGTYSVSAIVTDSAGNISSVSTSVSVIPVQRPGVSVTAVPQTAVVGGTINFTIQITAAPGVGIVRTSINFGAGEETRQLGGSTSITVQKQYASVGPRLVTVTVVDTTGATTEGTTTVSITP